MKKGIFSKLTLLDYIIIIIVVCAVAFAFIHITSDDTTRSESTSYDSSTLNKFGEKYLTYYRQGFTTSAHLDGFNASDGKPVTITGSIIWMDDDKGSNVKILIEDNGKQHLAGLYNHVPNADIYIDKITLESNGEKYKNTADIKAHPENITSINDLIKGIGNNTDYEITTQISVDSFDTNTFQQIINYLYQNNKRISVKGSNTGLDNQISLTRATPDELTNVSQILGDFSGITGEITIRIYNCSEDDLNTIKDNYDVYNIQKF